MSASPSPRSPGYIRDCILAFAFGTLAYFSTAFSDSYYYARYYGTGTWSEFDKAVLRDATSGDLFLILALALIPFYCVAFLRSSKLARRVWVVIALGMSCLPFYLAHLESSAVPTRDLGPGFGWALTWGLLLPLVPATIVAVGASDAKRYLSDPEFRLQTHAKWGQSNRLVVATRVAGFVLSAVLLLLALGFGVYLIIR